MLSLFQKIFEIQKEIGAIPKDSINPYYQSKYADINTYLEIIKPLLQKHKLLLLQPLSHVENKPAITTILSDLENGDRIENSTILPENSDPQKMGAAITYFRRFAIQSMFCLEAEDDDGNSASSRSQTVTNSPQTVKHTSQPVKNSVMPNSEQINDIDDPFYEEPKKKYAEKVVGEVCHDCKQGKYILNPKTNKVFCDQKCWLNK